MWHAGRVRFASFSPDGERIVTCSADNTARIWDAKSGYPLSGPLKHKAEVIFARFSADGQRLATASDDKTIYVWDLPTPGPSILSLERSDLVARFFAVARAVGGVGGTCK